MGALEDAIAAGNFQQAAELSPFFAQAQANAIGPEDISTVLGQTVIADPVKRAAFARIMARGGQQQQQQQAQQKRFLALLQALRGTSEDVQSSVLGRAGFKMPRMGSSLMKQIMLAQLRSSLERPEREERLRQGREGIRQRKESAQETAEFRADILEERKAGREQRGEAAASQEEDRIFKTLQLLEQMRPGSARIILEQNPEIMQRLIQRATQGATGKGGITVKRRGEK